MIDGEGVEDYGTSEVMKERRKMATDGIFTVAIAVTGNYVINEPVVTSHGFVFAENTGTETEIRALVQRAVENYDYENGDKDELSAFVRKSLKNYFYKRMKNAPFIVVSVLDV